MWQNCYSGFFVRSLNLFTLKLVRNILGLKSRKRKFGPAHYTGPWSYMEKQYNS